MTVSWDFYKNRRRIDIMSWKRSMNIMTYPQFLRALQNLGVDPIELEHPDVQLMNLDDPQVVDIAKDLEKPDKISELVISPSEVADRDRRLEELRLMRESISRTVPESVPEEKLEPKQEEKYQDREPVIYTKTELNKMKKVQVTDVLISIGFHPNTKGTKKKLIENILSIQEKL